MIDKTRKFTLEEIYNIVEVIEDVIPFPYNIIKNSDKIEFGSPISLIYKKDNKGQYSLGYFWELHAGIKYLKGAELNSVITRWNDYIADVLDTKFKSMAKKSLFLIFTILNFIIGFIIGVVLENDFYIILLNLIGLNAILRFNYPSWLKRMTRIDTKDYMKKVIERTKMECTGYTYGGYNSLNRAPIKISDTYEQISETKKENSLDIFISTIKKKLKKNNYKDNIKIHLNLILDIVNDIKNFIDKNPEKINDVLIKTEIDRINGFNNNILDIIDILDKPINKKIQKTIDQILYDYINIYQYYKESLSDSFTLSDVAKLKIIEYEVKAQSNYINVCKK